MAVNEAYQEALRRIEEARQKRGVVIDLSRLGLMAMPPEIGQLQALNTLLLYSNKLSCLPPEIGRLHALTQFNVSGNGLTVLPPEIGQLQVLRELNLSGKVPRRFQWMEGNGDFNLVWLDDGRRDVS